VNLSPNARQDTASLDRERIAKRVNGAVAADLQAIAIRENYARQRRQLDPQDIARELEPRRLSRSSH
jgi:hypothetical protein